MIDRLYRCLSNESAFDDILRVYRIRADRIMVGMNAFLLLVCLAIAPLRDTWGEVIAIGVPTFLLALWLGLRFGGDLLTRLFMACAFMVFTGLIIHQTGGDIEAHFSAFGLIGVLLYYRDWRTILAATVFIYLHHLVLGYAQTLGAPIYVFDSSNYWELFALHVAYFLPFVGMMGYLSIWLRREAYESQHVISLAQQIMQGSLTDTKMPLSGERETPLISAVVMMKNRLLDLLRVMPVPAAVIRINDVQIVNVNEAWKRTIGPVENRGSSIGDSWIWAEPGTWDRLMERLHEASEKLIDKVEVSLLRRDGTPLLCELSLILHEDVEPVMAILTIEDVTQRRKAEETMHRLAYSDQLTGLPNRTSLHAELEYALGQWSEKAIPFAVVMMDLDGFKPVNDTHGHDAGDEVLKVVASRLVAANRQNDLVARLGGDEFVILLNNCASTENAMEVAQRFIGVITRPIRLRERDLTITIGASAGVAHIESGEAAAEAILKHADMALYDSKAGGKNRVSVFSSVGAS